MLGFATTPELLEALQDGCGDDPSFICEQVYDLTGGNEDVTQVIDWVLHGPLLILVILAIAWIASRLARRQVERAVERFVSSDSSAATRGLRQIGIDLSEAIRLDEPDPRRQSRATSIANVVGSTLAVSIWVTATILIIGELGFDLGPFIAGAGIAGVALGFGAQGLVKDCIAGLFVLVEDQYGIGDYVDLGEASGEVEELTLRVTRLRSLNGTVWHVPNGEVRRVGNTSQLWSVALVDIDVAYDSDLEETRKLLLSTTQEVCRSEAWTEDVLEDPIVLGVEALGADGITMRMIVKTTPGSQWALQRRLREALKSSFDNAGIEIPFPQRTVWVRGENDTSTGDESETIGD